MSKRQKYEHAIALLEDNVCQIDYHLVAASVDGALRCIAARRRKQLCDAIVALGGDNPDDPGGSGGGGGVPPTLP